MKKDKKIIKDENKYIHFNNEVDDDNLNKISGR